MKQYSATMTAMIDAAEQAGKLLLEYFDPLSDKRLDVTEKALGNFVTAADTASEEKIKSLLEQAFPEYDYLMEESGASGSGKKKGRWIVDPLDGTTNFKNGLPTWSLSIALEVEGEVVAGVVYAPRLQELFWAEKGKGAWMQDRSQGMPAPDQKMSVTSTPTVNRALMDVYPQKKFVGDVSELLRDTGSDIRTQGSACLDLAYVAAGRYDAFVKEAKFGPWDLAAGSLLVQEAGGKVTDLSGKSENFVYGNNVLAANPALHANVLKSLQSSGNIFEPKTEKKGFSVDFLSDMHTEFWDEEFDYAAHKKSDIVIVDGDLATEPRLSFEILKKIAAIYETVLFVDGNHDYRNHVESKDKKISYPYNFDFKAVQKTLREGIAEIPNVVYLAEKPFVKDGVAIIGRNGHWDYKILKGYHKSTAISEGYKYLTGSFKQAATFSQLARQDYYDLRDELIRFSNDPSIHEIVVVTHTVPRVELLNWSKGVTPAKQAQMGSSLMRNLLQYDAHKKVKYWLFGHQHRPVTQDIGGVCYHENPRGFVYDGITGYKPSTFKF